MSDGMTALLEALVDIGDQDISFGKKTRSY
jgi:hypothetical protein